LAAGKLQQARQPEIPLKTTNSKVNGLPTGDLRPAKFAAFKEG
jgi:hypothetical protein